MEHKDNLNQSIKNVKLVLGTFISIIKKNGSNISSRQGLGDDHAFLRLICREMNSAKEYYWNDYTMDKQIILRNPYDENDPPFDSSKAIEYLERRLEKIERQMFDKEENFENFLNEIKNNLLECE